MQKRKILATAALVYANGPLHLGHMVEYLQADIWVRVQKLLGHECHFICGSDAHGTPIMLKARQLNITAETLIADMYLQHKADFDAFMVAFDHFYTTHSPENKALTYDIFQRLEKANLIHLKTITQLYDNTEKMFLPDRFVKGECPRCKSADQYGDNCEVCGASYSPTELINAVSVISGSTPIQKETEHVFFDLAKQQTFLQHYISTDHLPSAIANKLSEWTNDTLRDWDISRDAPYFGFEIPEHEGKYFYVWLDAPIGYMASFQHYCATHPAIHFDEFWQADSKTELWHFIGKDIAYFHSLFWPAVLQGAGYRVPSRIHVHGYLTVDGQKMSKSRGTFVTARDYVTTFNPEYLRYYFAAKLNSEASDIDLNWQDFMARVNADLINKYVNIASRCAGFITKKFDGKLSNHLDDEKLFAEFVDAKKLILDCFENLEYSKAVREIMRLADRANQYIDQQKPWALAKTDPNNTQIQAACTQGLNLFKVLTTYLKPILPITTLAVETFLNCAPLNFGTLDQPLLDHRIHSFKPLLTRIQPEALTQFIEKVHGH